MATRLTNIAEAEVFVKNDMALRWYMLIPNAGTAKYTIKGKTRRRYTSSTTDKCVMKKIELFLL